MGQAQRRATAMSLYAQNGSVATSVHVPAHDPKWDANECSTHGRGTVKQAFLHGRGGPRLMIRYGQAPQREISSLKLGATGICGTDLHFRNIGRLSCQCVKK